MSPFVGTKLSILPLEDRTNPSSARGFIDGEVLLAVNPGVDASAILSQVSANPNTLGIEYIAFDVYKVKLKSKGITQNAINSFSPIPGIRYVRQNGIHYPTSTVNDSRYNEMWHLNNTGQAGLTPGKDIAAERGWEVGVGTGDTIIAVLDSGMQFDHPDIAANVWHDPITGAVGYDFGDNDADPSPDYGLANGSNESGLSHGTHVAGTVGAVGNNGLGVTGVAQKTRMMALKIGSGAGAGASDSSQIAAINYAIAHGAKICTMSYGSDATALSPAMDALKAAGGIFVVAAGNDNYDSDSDLATNHFTQNNVIKVASSSGNDTRAGYSTWGKVSVDIFAPGGDQSTGDSAGILSTFAFPKDSYKYLQGTSMATPVVSGSLVAFWDANPELTYDEVIAKLYETADPVPGFEQFVRTGKRINFGNLMETTPTKNYIAVGTGAGVAGLVKVYNQRGRLVNSFAPYDPGFTGGVRVATGDVTGDGIGDIITAAGPGGGPHIRVFDAKTGADMGSFFSADPSFNGGLTLTTGDVDGDGAMEIIVGTDTGGGPRVTVFKREASTGTYYSVADFFAYAEEFNKGVRIAAADLDGDGKADIFTAPGTGGGPHVKVFSGASLLAGDYLSTLRSFFAGDHNDNRGLYIATGHITSKSAFDIIVTTGSGNSPTVRVYDGNTLELDQAYIPPRGQGGAVGLVVDQYEELSRAKAIYEFPSGILPPATTLNALTSDKALVKPMQLNGYAQGVRVAVTDFNNDGLHDIVLASGPSDMPRLTFLNGQSGTTIRTQMVFDPNFFGGVFVGAAVTEPK
jgi:subtilisin family serine protease